MLGSDPPAPELTDACWINADYALRLAEPRGPVVLLNSWVLSCYNCTNTVPSLVELDHRYRHRELTLIGIHTPEFPPYSGEHDKANLARALVKHGVTIPMPSATTVARGTPTESVSGRVSP